MSRTEQFMWTQRTFVSERCEWNGFLLEAWNDGRWLVYTPSREVCQSYADQVQGNDIKDAKRRAQAATLILIQLLSQNT